MKLYFNFNKKFVNDQTSSSTMCSIRTKGLSNIRLRFPHFVALVPLRVSRTTWFCILASNLRNHYLHIWKPPVSIRALTLSIREMSETGRSQSTDSAVFASLLSFFRSFIALRERFFDAGPRFFVLISCPRFLSSSSISIGSTNGGEKKRPDLIQGEKRQLPRQIDDAKGVKPNDDEYKPGSNY